MWLCSVISSSSRTHTHVARLPEDDPVGLWLYRNKTDSTNAVEAERFSVHKDGSLEIHNAMKEDMGKYSCIANNTEGIVSISSTLEVKGKRNAWSDGKSIKGCS